MDERGVIWQVDPEGDAMRDYKKRIAREKNEMARKAKEWEESRLRKQMETALQGDASTAAPETKSSDAAATGTPAAGEGEATKTPPAKDGKKTEGKKEKKAKPKARPVDAAVAAWLEGLKLSEYAPAFANNGYDDLAVIAELTNEELETMGIELPGHRKKILIAARKLSEL